MDKIIKIIQNFFYFAKNKHIPSFDAILIIFVFAFLTAWGFWVYSSNMIFPVAKVVPYIPNAGTISLSEPQEPVEKKFIPQPFTMRELKTRGCVADGLLSNFGNDANHSAALINRSPCIYLHRSLETWLNPPNFRMAEKIMQKIDKPRVVYGMFLSEAIRTNSKLHYDDGDRDFDFSKMCREGSDGAWGENSCMPDFKSTEYRKYLRYITRKAIDLGIQSFLFGQIYYQENATNGNPAAPEIVKEMRDYAKKKNVQIVIGAQTNSITDPNYLKLFDYIEGGVGISEQGAIENGPCWSGKSSCWALLWHPNFSQKANNVFLNLDWGGMLNDDMSKFARMDQDTRTKTLKNLYSYFTSKNMGFMMPYLAVVNKDNGGCYGPKRNFYSPDNRYKCDDEDTIAKIFNGQA